MYREIVIFVLISFCHFESSKEYSCLPDQCKNRSQFNLSNPNALNDFNFHRSPCFCDDSCNTYGDCCIDKQTNSTPERKINWSCEKICDNKYYYVISSCPSEWPDLNIIKLCQRNVSDEEYSYLLDIPVFSKDTKRVYANLFCAQCYGDINLKTMKLELHSHFPKIPTENVTVFMKNAKYVPRERKWIMPQSSSNVREIYLKMLSDRYKSVCTDYEIRRCKPAVTECLDLFRGSEVEKNCTSNINNYVSQKNVTNEIYKNIYCAKCNNVNLGDLNMNCSFGKRGIPRSDVTIPAYSVLFDVSPGSSPVGYKACPSGKILDRLYDVCISFGCGQLYDKIDGKCRAKNHFNISEQTDMINTNCPTLFVKRIDVFNFSNGDIYVNITEKTYKRGQYEIYNASLIRVCSEEYYKNKFTAFQSLVSEIILSISLCCLALHIIIHLLLPKLLNLPGKNLLSLSISLFIGQTVFLFGISKTDIKELCIVIGVIIHYCFLSVFFWMSIMSFNVYRNFTRIHCRMSVRMNSRTFLKYSITAWCLPLVIILSAIIVDQTNFSSEFRPGYGNNICWLSQRKCLLVFFVVPSGALMILNIIFFSLTARGIHQTSHMVDCAKRSSESARFYLYVKIAFVMGLTWIFGFLAALVDTEALWYLFIILNASQGFLIFIFFSFKRKVLNQLMKKFTTRSFSFLSITSSRNGNSHSSNRTSSSRMLSSQRSNMSS